jgi:hypothetical protein
MLSVRPPQDPVVLPPEGPGEIRLPLNFDQPDVTVVQIVIVGQHEEHALVPAVPPVRQRAIASHLAIGAAAAIVCVTAGFAAGIGLTRVPAPQMPAAPAALASIGAWLAAARPPRAQELTVSLAASPGVEAAGVQAGWVGNSDMSDRDVRVRLLQTDGVTTVAIDMKTEPRMAMLRAVSARAFDLELGPVSGPVRPQELEAGEGTRFINQISLRGYTTGDSTVVRARVRLDAPGVGNVRVVGRTVYVDFISPPGTPVSVQPPAAGA